MKVTLKNGYVENFAFVGDLVNGIEVDDSSIEDMEYFKENYSSYRIIDGTLALDVDAIAEIQDEADKLEDSILRSLRERECFPYINRGALWYAKLTIEEKKKLSEWYQDWLNVTETRMIPEKPSFLN